jgi:hypothetical protein
MTLYDVVADVCNMKTGTLTDDIKWDDIGVSSFMLQRWISMTNTRNACMVGLMTNHLVGQLDPVMAYQLYTTLASKSSRRFTYLKKVKHVPEKANSDRQYPPELSQRDKVAYDKLMATLEASAVAGDKPK